MNDFDPSSCHEYFEISKAELESLFISMAENLVLKGVIEPTRDAIIYDGEPTPFSFEYHIPTTVAKAIFYPKDDIEPIDARVQYDEKHRIDEAPQDHLIQDVYVFIHSRLLNTDVYVDQIIRISQDEKRGPTFSADIDMQYASETGRSLSAPAIEHLGSQEEKFEKAATQYTEGLRPFMIDDIEKLRQLIDHIGQAPRAHEAPNG